jgi:hypothetical protein
MYEDGRRNRRRKMMKRKEKSCVCGSSLDLMVFHDP